MHLTSTATVVIFTVSVSKVRKTAKNTSLILTRIIIIMQITASVCVLLNFVAFGYAFFSSSKYVSERRTASIRESDMVLHAVEEDPNFEAHLPSMLKAVIF